MGIFFKLLMVSKKKKKKKVSFFLKVVKYAKSTLFSIYFLISFKIIMKTLLNVSYVFFFHDGKVKHTLCLVLSHRLSSASSLKPSFGKLTLNSGSPADVAWGGLGFSLKLGVGSCHVDSLREKATVVKYDEI